MVSQARCRNFQRLRRGQRPRGRHQQIPGGPVASMEVIKLLGTNGGSLYGTGGAHPFEKPDRLHEPVRPAARDRAAVRDHLHVRPPLIGRRRQALAIAAVMAVIFLAHTTVAMQAELHGKLAAAAGVQQIASATSPGGNMEGKEVRFGRPGPP